jgi:glycosyltransferase involved in cell wall biosynthesis
MFVAMARAIPGENVRFLMTGQRIGKPTADSYRPEEIEAMVAGDARIRFLGFREAIEDLYAASDIIVVPSQKEEPCPAVLIEAAACGRPVVATSVGSNAEFVNHGETGFLVERDDLAALTGHVKMLIADAALRQRMGARAREIAEERFVREPIAKIEDIYASLAR